MNLAIEIAVSIVVFAVGGYKLDEKFQSYPWLTILGFIFGTILAFYQLYKKTKSNGGGY